MFQSTTKNNIWKMYAIAGLMSLTLYYAIDKVFMEVRGLSVGDIVLIEIIYSVVILLLEVPSGALADRWQRKYVLALNVVFHVLNTIIWIYSHNVWMFAIGVMAGGVHSVLKSGTFNSILYDSLKEEKREQDSEEVIGMAGYYKGILAIVGGIAGGLIADYYGIIVPFWLTLVFSAVALVLCLTLKEPEIHRTTGEVGYWKHIVDTFNYLWKNSFVYWLVIVIIVYGIVFVLIDEYAQLYFNNIGISLSWLGVLAAGFSLLSALGNKYAHRLKKVNRGRLYLFLSFVVLSGCVGIGLIDSWWGIIFSFLPILAVAIVNPLLYADFHRELPSQYRATGESYVSLLQSLIFVPVGIGFGYLSDRFTIQLAYLSLAGLVILMIVWQFVYLLRRKTSE